MATELYRRRTTLPEHLVGFCRFLRQHRFACGPREERDALEVLAAYIPAAEADFSALLRATLAKTKEEYLRFPELHQEYWSQLRRAENDKRKDKAEASSRRRPAPPRPPSIRQLKDWLYHGRQSDEEAEMAAYSAAEAFGRKDFSTFTATELTEVTEVLRRFAHLLHREAQRRRVKARRPGKIDLRRSIRDNLARGGDIDLFRWRKPRENRQRITVFCDVSKSMDLYSRFLLRFLYGFHRTGVKMESFVFSTSLTHLTPVLNDRELDASLNRLSELVPNWSAGTNLGKSLREFRTYYGRRYLGKKTTVIILSDGWDQGDTEVMDHELRFVHQHARELIWINPLAGKPDFKPHTRGMLTALPYIDHLTSAHNLETLVNLVRYLSTKGRGTLGPDQQHISFQ